MFVLSTFLLSVARILDIVLTVYYWLIIIRALISWVNPDPFNPIVQALHALTEPVLEQIRRKIPVFKFGIDVSPFIAVLLIIFLQSFLLSVLRYWAYRVG
jgi:YggT family protein